MTPQPNQLRFALASLLLIAIACIAAGAWLLMSGYQSGELFVGIVGTIAGAMAGMISMRDRSHSGGQAPDAAANVEISNVNTTPQTPKDP